MNERVSSHLPRERGAFVVLVAVASLFMPVRHARAQTHLSEHSPATALGAVTFKTLIEEIVHPFTLRPYTAGTAVKLVPRKDARYTTPEDAAAANLSSLVAGDFEWNGETWTAESLRAMEEKDRAAGHDRAYWQERWKKAYSGVAFELTQRVDYGRYVLVEYRVIRADAPADTPPLADTLVLVKRSGAWKLTQELAEDPILLHWNAKTLRIQSAPKALFAK